MLSCYSLPVRVEEYKKLCICEQREGGGQHSHRTTAGSSKVGGGRGGGGWWPTLTAQLTPLLILKLKTSYWLKLVFYAFIIQTFNSRHDLLLND